MPLVQREANEMLSCERSSLDSTESPDTVELDCTGRHSFQSSHFWSESDYSHTTQQDITLCFPPASSTRACLGISHHQLSATGFTSLYGVRHESPRAAPFATEAASELDSSPSTRERRNSLSQANRSESCTIDESISSYTIQGCSPNETKIPSPEEHIGLTTGPRLDDRERSIRPFRRWLSTLRRRTEHSPQTVTPRMQRWVLDDFDPRPASPKSLPRTWNRRSSSYSSSFGFVTAVKSATATIASASASIATATPRTNIKQRHRRRGNSLLSASEPRQSIDSGRSNVDRCVRQRSIKRSDKLAELIKTEESYTADLRALLSVYSTVLGSPLATVSFAKASMQKNLMELFKLHRELLGHLYQIVPSAEFDQKQTKATTMSRPRGFHTRWHSIDTVPLCRTQKRTVPRTIHPTRRSLNLSRSSEEDPCLPHSDPCIAAACAKAFSAVIDRFVLYEDYGTNYESLQRDIDDTQHSTNAWLEYDRAIEILSAHIDPLKSREVNGRKAMTVKDLLIKPIQRLPRYELLFNELCHLTPVCDDPESNAAIRHLTLQLRETCSRVNNAKKDPVRSQGVHTAWTIADRLRFPSQVQHSRMMESFGQVFLCGCLYVAYRGREHIKGKYVICVLFRHILLLATPEQDYTQYEYLAGISLANAALVECDNGKGLQCYTAPYSWKLVFEYAARMYEMIFTACSSNEEEVWRTYISSHIDNEHRTAATSRLGGPDLYSPMIGDMRSVGKAFGKAGSFVRRLSVRRTATVGPTSDLNQVIIKNTQAVKDATSKASTTSLQIPRSQSVLTPSHVQTLAPRRADRVHLESLLSDVWTKDLISYPGMIPRRSDPLRASANHVIRKFSMASITNSFTHSKRSVSYTSIERSRHKEDAPPSQQKKPGNQNRSTRHPPVVDFHTAPEAFLPTDFELKDSIGQRKRSALRTFTMTLERPFSPLLSDDSRPNQTLRRAQSAKATATKSFASQFSPNTAATSKPTAPTTCNSQLKREVEVEFNPCDSYHAFGRDGKLGSKPLDQTESQRTPAKKKSKSRFLKLFG